VPFDATVQSEPKLLKFVTLIPCSAAVVKATTQASALLVVVL
jgi:hypothetical protein